MAKNVHGLTRCLLVMVVVVSIFAINIKKPMALHERYTNYFGIEMTDDEYQTLINLGFTDDEIYLMEREEFLENKDLDATLIGVSHKYYKIVYPMYGASYVTEVSELEYTQHKLGLVVEPFNTVITTYLDETSSISQNGNKYRYKNLVNWTTIPNPTSYDVIAIGFISSVYIDSNLYFRYTYGDSQGNFTNSTLYYGETNTAYGASKVYLIPSQLTSLSARLYFDVSKNTNDTLTSLTICGDYAHSSTTVTHSQANSYFVNSGGITFDPAVYNYFYEIPCANETAYVNW